MTSRLIPVRLGMIAAVLVATAARADDARVEALEQRLRQRDMVISELLDRVGALERRLGVQRSAREAGRGKTSPPVPAPAGRDDRGPASPPGKVVVREDEAERALERSLTRDGALLLRPGVLEIEPSLRYTRQEDRTPTLVNSGGVVFAGETRRNANSLTADLALRLGLPWDSQLEVGVPYQWRDVETVTSVGFTPQAASSQSGSGLGDLRLGLAKTLLREGLWRPDLVGRITWNTGSGESDDNGVALGGGFQKIGGSLSAIKRQDPIAFVGGLSYDYRLEKDQVQPGATVSANFGSYIALSPESSVRLLLSAGYQEETKLAGRTIPGSDRVIGTFLVGGSTLIARGTLLNLSVGMGLTDDADDFSVMLSLPTRFN